MPPIWKYHCDTCSFKMTGGWGGSLYVLNKDNERISCVHPTERATIRRMTGLSFNEAREQGKIGFESYCVCLTCLHQDILDLQRDSRLCSSCSEGIVVSANELLDKKCPKCRNGTFIRTDSGVIC